MNSETAQVLLVCHTPCIRHPLMTSIRHGPDRLVSLVVLIAFPGVTADVQIFVRGPCKHHPSAFVTDRGRKAICRSIERPCDHPVRSYWNSGTGSLRTI